MTHGPNATWEYIKKISASIPTQRKVKNQVEADLNHFGRGISHTSPDAEADIARLQESYKSSEIHVYTPKRHLDHTRRAKNYVDIGHEPDRLQNTIDRWAERRLTVRSKQELWQDEETVSNERDLDEEWYWENVMDIDQET